ncbi:hypothetical protein [Streptomyces benahoarensis]|uniref:L-amino acid ligase C-terminal domain-containing protein n=1 Tax=Streptomyces benahoarensis TaxID=2595054 RepID=A0A553YJL7_9ACTN|nr:hypothetical protein [Streptomyces benahoarensis]TSB21318.1 hypothetical protein FNJ62_19110 [Streptomyces benahoarensis]TSB29360.1 hypothetical protein FNZ23_26370 [Streptomyces benahoarensis]
MLITAIPLVALKNHGPLPAAFPVSRRLPLRTIVKPGTEITPACWSADRHGFVVVAGATAPEVDARLAEIRDQVVCRLVPTG